MTLSHEEVSLSGPRVIYNLCTFVHMHEGDQSVVDSIPSGHQCTLVPSGKKKFHFDQNKTENGPNKEQIQNETRPNKEQNKTKYAPNMDQICTKYTRPNRDQKMNQI